MYKNPVAVNRHDHNRLRFTPADNFSFASGLTHIGVQAFELERLSEYYPIVFDSHTGKPLAVLGLVAGSNAWLNEHFQWCAPIIPAELSCYPFGLQAMDDGQYVIILDADAETLQAKKGRLLYNRRGSSFIPSPLLKEMKVRLQEIERNKQLTAAAFSVLVEYQVLCPGQLNFELNGKPHCLNGFSVLDWEVLEALDATVKEGWKKTGLWRLLEAQTASVDNFKRLQQMRESVEV